MSSGKPWTNREEQLLRKLWPVTKTRDLLPLFQNRTTAAISSRAKVLGVLKEIGAHKEWSRAEIHLLRKIYPDKSTKMVARMLGRTVESVNGRAVKLKLHKSAEYMASLDHIECERLKIVGGPHRFQKGIVPANKGLRRPGYFRGRMRETQFKKGQKGHNWLPVGTVKLNADGYLVRKIADEPNAGVGALNTNWEFVHRRVWEDAHGPIPKGYRIWWKDGNHENCALENLELLSGQEHMARTTKANLPPEIQSAMMQLAWFKRKLRKIEEGRNERN